VGSASGFGVGLSDPAEFATPMNEQIENGSFEGLDSRFDRPQRPGRCSSTTSNQIPRLNDPSGQPAGGPIDGLVGPHPSAGPVWHDIASRGGGIVSHRAYASGSNKNGGVYQRVKVTPGRALQASMRMLTFQDPIDGSHPASNTACAIAIDATAARMCYRQTSYGPQTRRARPTASGDDVSVRTIAAGDIISVSVSLSSGTPTRST